MSWSTPMPDGIRNVHERVTAGPFARAAGLLAELASTSDALWPRDRWPALELDEGLAPGSSGGHGPIRYEVAEVGPGSRVRFTMLPASPVAGEHEFVVTERPDGRVHWRHELRIRPVTLAARVFLPLHDALLEDLLDQAEAMLADEPLRRHPLPHRARALRAVLGRRRPRHTGELRPRWSTEGAAPNGGRRNGDQRLGSTPGAGRATSPWPGRVAAGALGVVAGLHVVWATGRTWPLRDRERFARTVLGGERVREPGPAACLTVAGLLTGVAATLLDRTARPDRRLLPDPAARLVLGAATAGFGLRAVGLPGVAGFLAATPEPFRTLDRRLYSPACLALAAVCGLGFRSAGR